MIDFWFGCFLCCLAVGKAVYCHVMSGVVRKGEVACDWSVSKCVFVLFFIIKIFARWKQRLSNKRKASLKETEVPKKMKKITSPNLLRPSAIGISYWRRVWSTLFPYIQNRLKKSRLNSYDCVSLNYVCFTSIEVKKQSKAKQTSKIQTKKVPNCKLSLHLCISASSSMSWQSSCKLWNEQWGKCFVYKKTYQNEPLILHHPSSIRQLFLNCFSSNSFKWARACVLLRCNVTWKKLIFVLRCW